MIWRKSSYSGGNGGCVEVAWRKSSFSGGNGDCVEVAVATTVAVRDSKNSSGPVLDFPFAQWCAFLTDCVI
jgi:hypothetical protein